MVTRIFFVLLSLTFFSSASAELPSLSFLEGASLMLPSEVAAEKVAAEKVAAEKVSPLTLAIKNSLLYTGRAVISSTLSGVGVTVLETTLRSGEVSDLILDACLSKTRPAHPSLESVLTRALLEDELFQRQCSCLQGVSCK